MDTDDYFWENSDTPYTVKRETQKRLELMKNDIAKYGNAVISGALVKWGNELIPLFTLAIRLETDVKTRIERLRNRERAKFGSRIDIGGDMYETHCNFIEWASAYDNGGLEMRSKAQHDEWQKLLKCRQIRLDGSMPAEDNFEKIKMFL